VVPDAAYRLHVVAVGGKGGEGSNPSSGSKGFGGFGAIATADLAVHPGQVIYGNGRSLARARSLG
jgi:hypothetical protein